MTKLKFYPHAKICPKGLTVEAKEGESILNVALKHGIDIEHACEKSCACTTCHVIVRKGFDSLDPPTDIEEDLLDRAWGLEAESRLSCQAVVGEEDLDIEIPQYTVNQVSEKK